MHIHIKHDGRVRRLPKSIQEYIITRYKLLPEYVKMLRCFEYQGEVGGKQVRRLRIFSPENAASKHLIIKTRQDLERYPEMLLFEGYIDGQGKAYAADRRVPVRSVKKGGSSFTKSETVNK